MKKTKLTRSLLAACSIVALTAVMYGCVHGGGDDAPATDTSGTPDPVPDPAAPVDVMMYVDVSGEAEQDALLAVLPDTGDSDTLTVPAGGSAMRGGIEGVVGPVVFTCMSDHDCTFTVTNNLGTIVASVSTQKLPDADDPTFTAEVPMRADTFAELNEGSAAGIRGEVMVDSTLSPEAPTLQLTELTGMGIGESGVLNADKAGLRSLLDPNGADFGGAPGNAAAPPGDAPTLTMGSMLTGADHAIDPSDDMAPAPDGWGMKTLFADWGDTATDPGDGGFETGAIVVKNLGEGEENPFDADLHDLYVNVAAQRLYDLTVLADGDPPTVTSLATSVDITSTAATSAQWAAMVFDSTSLVEAQDQDLLIDEGETFRGMYFGAPGKFQCAIMSGPMGCALARNDDGTVGVNDTNADPDVVASTGRWTFTPDPGAMIEVPDQDWMAYGAWLTTPDNTGGTHRIGVFFNGMDPYEGGMDAYDATLSAGLRGSATYSGGATGIYVDDDDSGLFTARAMLDADFDKASDGMDDAVDYMISGRIDNFRDTAGYFLGADTAEDPNDPDAGGENDWVVVLTAADFGTAADNGTLALTPTGGSADGVEWSGMWNGQLFGPNTDADGDNIHPSGVGGRFWAETGMPGDATPPTTAVVGAFGADKDD